MRRQALQDEIERLAPPADPQLAQAERLLSDFAAFWETETSPAERHRLLTTLFEQIWQDNGTIVAAKPRGAFVPYFQAATQTHQSESGAAVQERWRVERTMDTASRSGHRDSPPN
jgi:hypothetical protein